MAAYRLSLEQYEAYQARLRRFTTSNAEVGAAVDRKAEAEIAHLHVVAAGDQAQASARSSSIADSTPAAAAPNKYHNVRTRGYASKKEADRAFILKLMQEAGEISELHEQVVFPIIINGVKICSYKCDFCYLDIAGREVVEDVKSKITAKLPTYRLKKKLVRAVLGIEIKEV